MRKNTIHIAFARCPDKDTIHFLCYGINKEKIMSVGKAIALQEGLIFEGAQPCDDVDYVAQSNFREEDPLNTNYT